ncbi:MAG: hypothetical protein CENE_01664 [Candidatus Celerinatantimonas neptuna]|nr:MAG: hypothetical protein CENE_01664 [Candidatus Celerinatantimonas neptuna]
MSITSFEIADEISSNLVLDDSDVHLFVIHTDTGGQPDMCR